MVENYVVMELVFIVMVICVCFSDVLLFILVSVLDLSNVVCVVNCNSGIFVVVV